MISIGVIMVDMVIGDIDCVINFAVVTRMHFFF